MDETSLIILGGNNNIAKEIKAQLSSCSIRLILVNRGDKSRSVIAEQKIYLSKIDVPNLETVFNDASVVVNLVYDREADIKTNLKIIKNICIAANNKKIKKLIHISSIDVVGRCRKDLIHEDIPCSPVTEYAKNRLELEKQIFKNIDNNIQLIVLRSAAIIDKSGGSLGNLVNNLKSRSRLYNYTKACISAKRKMNIVCVENVATAILFLAMKYDQAGRIVFQISDDDSNLKSYKDIEKHIRKYIGVSNYLLPVIPLPMIFLKIILVIINKDNINPARSYSSKKLENAGYKKKLSWNTVSIIYSN